MGLNNLRGMGDFWTIAFRAAAIDWVCVNLTEQGTKDVRVERKGTRNGISLTPVTIADGCEGGFCQLKVKHERICDMLWLSCHRLTLPCT